jgi:hypothetical protein
MQAYIQPYASSRAHRCADKKMPGRRAMHDAAPAAEEHMVARVIPLQAAVDI